MTTATQVPRRFIGLPAPAKLNLFLHVIGRRTDGKHLLEAEKDLCVRAAAALRDAAGKPLAGAEIHVKKRIPAGAGMGGGSSDAATTLIALNQLWGLDLPREELALIGETLGADIPFFIRGKNAFVEGIGEIITPMDVPPAEYAVLWPGRGVSTAKIFSSPSLTRDSESLKIAIFSDLLRNRWPELPGHNDLQKTAVGLEPAILQALDALAPFGEARMTGSGSAVFALNRTGSAEPASLMERIPVDWRFFSVRSLPEHPLCAWTRSAEEESTGV